MSKKLTKQEIRKIREILKEKLEKYYGKEHIKLDIEPKDLEKIIFKPKLNSLVYLQNLAVGNSREDSKELATYYTFAIDLDLLKKLDLTGVSFFQVDVRGENFAGSKGINLSPQFVYLQDFSHTTLTDVKILATFHDCKIVGTNFTGSKGAIIEPQKVHKKNLSYAILKNVEIKGYIDDCIVEGTVFDENINVDKLYSSKTQEKLITSINKAFYIPCDAKPIDIEHKTKKRRKKPLRHFFD